MAPPTLLVLNEPMLNSAPPRAPTTFCCATARPVEALTWTTRIAGEHPPFPLHLRVPVTEPWSTSHWDSSLQRAPRKGCT